MQLAQKFTDLTTTKKVELIKDFYKITAHLSQLGVFYYDKSTGQWEHPNFKLIPETLEVFEVSELMDDSSLPKWINTTEIHKSNLNSLRKIESLLIEEIFKREGFHD